MVRELCGAVLVSVGNEFVSKLATHFCLLMGRR